jgi:hypothetical protein
MTPPGKSIFPGGNYLEILLNLIENILARYMSKPTLFMATLVPTLYGYIGLGKAKNFSQKGDNGFIGFTIHRRSSNSQFQFITVPPQKTSS